MLFVANTQDVQYNLSTGVGCANCRFSHTAFQGSQQTNAIQFAGTTGGDFTFDNCFIADDPITISGSSNWRISFATMNDFENTVNTTNIYVTQSSGVLGLTGVNIFQQVKSTGSIPTAFISSSGGHLYIRGMYAVSQQTMTALVALSGSVNLDMEVLNDIATAGTLASMTSSSTTGVVFKRSSVSDQRWLFPQTIHLGETGAQANQTAGQSICYADNGLHRIKCSNFHEMFTGEMGAAQWPQQPPARSQ